MSASRLVRAAQGQVIDLLNQIEKMSEHISALQSENDRLTAQNTTQTQASSHSEQLYRKPDHVSNLSFENAFLKRRNSYLSSQNTAQSAQIADLLWILADIAEAAAELGDDDRNNNLRDQISRYVTGMEIRSRASAPPSQ